MAKKPDQDAQRAAARQARREGESPSAAGATTGASKQREHVRHKDDRHSQTAGEERGRS